MRSLDILLSISRVAGPALRTLLEGDGLVELLDVDQSILTS